MADSRADAGPGRPVPMRKGEVVAGVTEFSCTSQASNIPGPSTGRWPLQGSVQPGPWIVLIFLSSSPVADLTPYSNRTLGCHFDKSYKLLINWFPGKEKCLIEASDIMCYPWGGKQPITDFWSQTRLCEFQLHFLLVLHPWAISLNFLSLRVLIYKVGIMSFGLKTL